MLLCLIPPPAPKLPFVPARDFPSQLLIVLPPLSLSSSLVCIRARGNISSSYSLNSIEQAISISSFISRALTLLLFLADFVNGALLFHANHTHTHKAASFQASAWEADLSFQVVIQIQDWRRVKEVEPGDRGGRQVGRRQEDKV